MTGPTAGKTRVAILGGGQAGLTVALQLTDPANPKHDQYEVTVHQLGWRLGGKGATGRPTDEPWAAARIEEHGLHNWFGFYDNSFAQMRTVYTELNRPPNAPVATFDQAFIGANEAVFVEKIQGQPRLWTVHNLTNGAQPGIGGLFLSPWDYLDMAIELIKRMLGGTPAAALTTPLLAQAQAALERAAKSSNQPLTISVATLRDAVNAASTVLGAAKPKPIGDVSPLLSIVDKARREGGLAGDVIAGPPWIDAISNLGIRGICWTLWLFMDALWQVVKNNIETPAKDTERRLWIGSNMAYACIVGALLDGVVDNGFDVINHLDFRAWLGQHLYDDGGVTMRSPVLEAIYTASFAYPAGNADCPPGQFWPPAENMEAGTALRGIARTAFTYKGSFAYRFAAGTADTCYAPIYEVLAARGVQFEFFHRVRTLSLTGSSVSSIDLGVQAQPAAAGASYAPLMNVAGLPCWPDQPLWAQLANAAWFQSVDADLESPTAQVIAKEAPLTLTKGVDFDEVVLAIPIAALPSICADLIAASPAWATSVNTIETVRTQALQVWWTQPTDRLGLVIARPPIVTWLYDAWSPLNVWGDYREIIEMEGWPPTATPKALAYFCSTLPDAGANPFDPYPPQPQADAIVKTNAVELLQQGIGIVLPNVTPGGQVDWTLLFDPRPVPGIGQTRLDAQYWRGNVTASERYVLSVVGSSVARLPAHDPAFSNLWLAGDWTVNTLNCGCMEAATMSGMLCSNALSGFPLRSDIIGVDF
jgi:uncharacterized protein with NAD-binding domain and iron-sulfur cluster